MSEAREEDDIRLREVQVHAPVKVRNCHLAFTGKAGADQLRRRAHLVKSVEGDLYWLEGETTFKGGETIVTDFVFPKSMMEKAEYTDGEYGEEASLTEDSDEIDLDAMKVDELKALAAENEIDLAGLTKKDDIVAAITKALADDGNDNSSTGQ